MADISHKQQMKMWISSRHQVSSIFAILLPALVTFLSVGFVSPAAAQCQPCEDDACCLPYNALFVSLGGGLNSVNFGDQDIIAVGTSVLSDNGTVVASGSAGQPANAPNGTPIQMDTQLNFAPSVQAGYFRHFECSDWLWGSKFTYDYMGTTSNFRRPLFPQAGTFTQGANAPVPFTGNAVALVTQTELINQIAFRPFIGQSFKRGFVYVGGGPTLSQERTSILQLVGFADINGNRGDISGAPQDFSTTGWVWGGSAEVGVTYFFNRSCFLDCSYVLGFTGKRSFNFASDFSSTFTDANGTVLTQQGTLVGSSTWDAISQGIGFRIGRAF